jgi:hypothetical protein
LLLDYFGLATSGRRNPFTLITKQFKYTLFAET